MPKAGRSSAVCRTLGVGSRPGHDAKIDREDLVEGVLLAVDLHQAKGILCGFFVQLATAKTRSDEGAEADEAASWADMAFPVSEARNEEALGRLASRLRKSRGNSVRVRIVLTRPAAQSLAIITNTASGRKGGKIRPS